MILAMIGSARDTFFRAIVMGSVLGLVVWGAIRYTTIPQQMLQRVTQWSQQAANKLGDKHQADPQQTTPLRPDLAGHTQLPGTPNTHLNPPTQQLSPGVATGISAGAARDTIERRLRELGAVYCLLETYGRHAPRYRYHCQISPTGDPQLARSFEANSSSPDGAMHEVLLQVEGYRAQAAVTKPRYR